MDDTKDRTATHLNDTRQTLSIIDREYTSVGCLGIGGFGSVFLAQKKSGRKVALKIMQMDTSDDEEYEQFLREVEAVNNLNQESDNENRDLHIIFFEDWYISRNFVCIVMQYADGGTLAQEIERKSKCNPMVPYAERRIGWYALQLCDALAFAHERGVAHHDVKAANILIDASAGGKILLADFGTALAPGEETVGFTISYASPELLASHELEDFGDLRADKIDSFALGCVLYELLMCKKLGDVSKDQTLADYIGTDSGGVDSALSNMALPWLPPSNGGSSLASFVGYTHELKSLVMNFLKPNANERLLPGDIQQSLRSDPLSPLLLPHVSAAQTAKPGAPLTIDNIQLGLLVQRGPDWSDGDDDGGEGSVGVIVKLDGDGNYVWVAFPSLTGAPTESICCRMGANNKSELQACCIPDYISGNGVRSDGNVHVGKNISNISIGQMINPNCVVVGVNNNLGVAFVAPINRISTPSLPKEIQWRTNNSSFATLNEEIFTPSYWQLDIGPFMNIELDSEKGTAVLELLYDKAGGLIAKDCLVKSIQRVQDKWLWESYTQRRRKVADENWGIENEINAFMAVESCGLNNSNLHNFQSSGKQFSTKARIIHYKFNIRSPKTDSQILLCRVVVGRVQRCVERSSNSGTALKSHTEVIADHLYSSRGTCLAYPEYIITYKDNSVSTRNVYNVNNSQPSGRSASKMCTICFERPVRYLTIPCGHPCLCEKCNNAKIRKKLKGKCPECRGSFYSTSIIYGRVVNDE